MIEIWNQRKKIYYNVQRMGATPQVIDYGMEIKNILQNDSMTGSEVSSFYQNEQKHDVMSYVIMPRYGDNIENIFVRHDKQMSLSSIVCLGI